MNVNSLALSTDEPDRELSAVGSAVGSAPRPVQAAAMSCQS